MTFLSFFYLFNSNFNCFCLVKSKQLQQEQQPPRKTIILHPGEAIKLTSTELKPKKITTANTDKLVYFLVSSALKFGDLKLKKVLPLDSPSSEQQLQQQGWSKVNDIYLEKSGVREFTQLDLDNGNVWYESFNQIDSSSSSSSSSLGKSIDQAAERRPCRNRSKNPAGEIIDEYEYNGVHANFCDEDNDIDDFSSSSSSQMFDSTSQQVTTRYDHCMFEVYHQDKLDELISKEIIHFSIQREIINETVLGLEVLLV